MLAVEDADFMLARAASDGPAVFPCTLRWLVEELHEPDGDGRKAGKPCAMGYTCRGAGSRDGNELIL